MSATSENDLSGKVGLDTTAFKTGVTELVAQVKSIETSFRASAAVMGDWSSSTQGLSERVSSLEDKLKLQKQALSMLNSEYQKAVSEQGADSKSAQSLANQMFDMEKKISSTEGQLKKYQSSLQTAQKEEKENSSTTAQLGKAFSDLSEKSKQTTSNIKDHFSGIKSAISGAMLGITAALTGGAGLIAFSNDAIKAGDNAYTLSEKMHLPADQAVQLNRELSLTDTDSQAFISTMTRIDKSLETAGKSGNATTKSLEEFGVKLTDGNGKLLPMNEQLAALAAGYQKASASGNEQAYTAQILGNRGVALTGILADYTNVAEQASKIKGIGIDPETAHKVEQSLTTVKQQVSQLGMTAANALLPFIQQYLPQVQTGLANLATQVKSHQGDIKAAIASVTSLAQTAGSAIAYLGGPGIGILAAIAGVIGTIKAAILASNVVQGINNALTVTAAINTGGLAAGEEALAAAKGSTTLATLALSAATIKDTAQNIAHAAAQIASAAAAKAAAAGQWLLTAALNANPIGIVIAAIAALVAAMVVLYNNNKQFRDFINGMWAGIKSTAQAVGNWFSGPFVDFFKGAFTGVQAAWNAAPGFFSGLGSKISSAMSATGDFIKENWKSLAVGIVNPVAGAASLLYKYNPGFKAWADSAMQTIKAGFTSGMEAVKSVFTAAWNGIVTVVKAIVQPFVNGILDFWRNMQTGLSDIMNGVKNMFSGAWELIKNIVMAPVLLLCDLVTGNFSQMGTDLSKIWTNIQNALKQIWDGILQFGQGFTETINSIMLTAWQHITENVTTAWNDLVAFFTTTWAAISSGVQAFWNALPGFFANLWVTIQSGITTAWNAVLQFFAQLWVNIGNGIKAAWNGYWAIVDTISGVMKAGIINIWNSILAWFQNLPETLHTVGANMFTSMQTGVNSTINNVTSAVKTGLGDAINWITSLPSEALQWGRDIIDGIAKGIRDAADAVGDAVKGVAQDIRKFLHFSVPDEGPLVDFPTWMPDFMSGLAQGIEANKYKVAAAMRSLASDMSVSVPVSPAYAGGYSAPSGPAPVAGASYTFYQYNTSPKALTPSETARQSRNMFRQAALQSRRR